MNSVAITIQCPCCGRPDTRTNPIEAIAAITLSGHERRIALSLAGNFGHVVAMATLIDAVYGDDPEGGPLTADVIIKVMLVRLRRRLAPFGLAVNNVYGVGYRLVWLPPMEAE